MFFIEAYQCLSRRSKINILLCVKVSISKKSAIFDIIYEYSPTWVFLGSTLIISLEKVSWRT